MTTALAACLLIQLGACVATAVLVIAPPTRSEVAVWRFARVQVVRRWITRRRRVTDRLHATDTTRGARRNLLWHLCLTGVFAFLAGGAVAKPDDIWSGVLALLLVAPGVAYLVGSLVQRQKIATIAERRRTRRCSGHPPQL